MYGVSIPFKDSLKLSRFAWCKNSPRVIRGIHFCGVIKLAEEDWFQPFWQSFEWWMMQRFDWCGILWKVGCQRIVITAAILWCVPPRPQTHNTGVRSVYVELCSSALSKKRNLCTGWWKFWSGQELLISWLMSYSGLTRSLRTCACVSTTVENYSIAHFETKSIARGREFFVLAVEVLLWWMTQS